jgi:hypothetical protein
VGHWGSRCFDLIHQYQAQSCSERIFINSVSNTEALPNHDMTHPSSPLRRNLLRAGRLRTLGARPVETALRRTTGPLLPLELGRAPFQVRPCGARLALDGAVARHGRLPVAEVALQARAALRLVAVLLGARLALRGLAKLCRVVDRGGGGAG